MKALQRVIKTAQYICGAAFPSLQTFTTPGSQEGTQHYHDTTHPQHTLFTLPPSGRCYRSVKARTTKLKLSFYLQAIRLLNYLIMTTLYTQPFSTESYNCTMYIVSNVYIQYISISFSAFCCMQTVHMLTCHVIYIFSSKYILDFLCFIFLFVKGN